MRRTHEPSGGHTRRTHEGGHMEEDTRRRTHGGGHTEEDTRKRTHGRGHLSGRKNGSFNDSTDNFKDNGKIPTEINWV